MRRVLPERPAAFDGIARLRERRGGEEGECENENAGHDLFYLVMAGPHLYSRHGRAASLFSSLPGLTRQSILT
jgi:hypothetical protein